MSERKGAAVPGLRSEDPGESKGAPLSWTEERRPRDEGGATREGQGSRARGGEPGKQSATREGSASPGALKRAGNTA